MKGTAVVYKSTYGDTKQYAQWLAATLDADLLELGKDTVAHLSPYSIIIYGAGIYAGTINGFSRFKQIFKAYPEKQFILFTVGLSSTVDAQPVKSVTEKCFSSEMHAKVKAFHFIGGIDYKRLRFFHRVIMTVVVKVVSKTKPEDMTDDIRRMITSYGKTMSFADEASLEPLLTYTSSLMI